MGLKMRLFTLSPSVTLRPPQSVSEQSRLAAKPMKDTRIGEDGFVIGQRKTRLPPVTGTTDMKKEMIGYLNEM